MPGKPKQFNFRQIGWSPIERPATFTAARRQNSADKCPDDKDSEMQPLTAFEDGNGIAPAIRRFIEHLVLLSSTHAWPELARRAARQAVSIFRPSAAISSIAIKRIVSNSTQILSFS